MRRIFYLAALAASSIGCSDSDDGGGESAIEGTGGLGFGGVQGQGGAANPSSGGAANPSSGGAANPSSGGAANPSSGGASAGGSGACVENLGCQLEPPPTTGDLHQDCVNRINQFRTECACLAPLARWTDGEACADQMAEYDNGTGEAHSGFRDGICEGGSGQNECPRYRSEESVISGCLQSMWNEGPPPQNPCNDACFQEYGHFINMTNPRNTKVACGFYTNGEARVWSVQNFSR